MSKLRDRARGLLAAKELLHAETVRLHAKQRTAARRSRQQLRRKRAAEALAADLIASRRLPLSHDLTRRKLAKMLLDQTFLPELFTKAEIADLEARLSHKIKTGSSIGKAAYWTTIGEAPVCEPGDTTAARLFHRKIIRAIDDGGWTRSERAALHVLEKRWRRRADGTDARFMEVGTAGAGRLHKAIEARIKTRG